MVERDSIDEGHDLPWEAWIDALAQGDPEVAAQFWDRYGSRLERLAGQHLAAKLQRRLGADDVAQSVCRTFLRRAADGQFRLEDGDGLWRLLCAITLTKIREKARFHLRKKRSINQEQPMEGGKEGESQARLQIAAHEPTPAEAAEFADQFEKILSGLDAEEQSLVRLKLEQCTNQEVADRIGCSERTVRRLLKKVQTHLQKVLDIEKESE